MIAGRAIWAEAARLQGDELETFPGTAATERMRKIAEACKSAKAWTEYYAAPAIGEGWYR